MKLADAAEYYEYSGLSKSPATQRWITARLSYFVQWCASQGIVELPGLKPLHVQKYLDGLARGEYAVSGTALSSYTVNGHGRIIRAWLNWCVKNPDVRDEVKPHLPKSLHLPKVRIKVIEHFSTEQLDRLLAACSKECHPQLIYRDRAIVILLRDTGIRASELCGLTLGQVYLDPAESFIRVVGKGNKEREVGLIKDARAALYRYIHRYRKAHAEERCVFTNQRNQPLTPNGLDQTLYRLRDWAHVTGVRCSAHTFRHSFAVNYLRATGDLYKLARILGHSTTQVTEIYLRSVTAKDARRGMSQVQNYR